MATAQAAGELSSKPSIFEDVDKSLFIGALGLVLLAAVPMILYPESAEAFINRAFAVATQQLGWMYMIAGFGSFLFLMWLAFGPLGNKVLGKRGEVEYSNLTWISMLFCGGVGAGILFNAFSDWVWLIQMPIQGSEPMSAEAAQWAQTYGIFHWGPIAWAMYASLAVPIGYLFYVRKIPMLNISQLCRGLLGGAVDGPVGKVIDLLFMVGLLGAAATSLGLGTPIVAAGFTAVFGIERSFGLEFGVLVLVTLIFSVRACRVDSNAWQTSVFVRQRFSFCLF